MTRIRLKYIHEYRDASGKLRRYLRRRGKPSILLPGLPGSAEFMEAYKDALSTVFPTPVRNKFAPDTLGALAVEFYRSAEFSNLRPSSKATYRTILDPIIKADGHRLVKDLPADKARKIIQEIGETRRGMANLTRAVLRRLIKFGIGLGWRKDNPFDAAPTYKLGTYHTWTESELTAYEAQWPVGTRERLAFDILLYTGQRAGDAVRMKRSDIVGDAIHIIQEKTGAELYVAIHPALARALSAGPNNGNYLISDGSGNEVQRRTLSNLIVKAAAAAGLPRKCIAHGLRKAALRRLAEYGSTSKQIQAVSGHRTLGEIERYTRQADQVRLARSAIRLLPDKGGT